MHITVDNLKEQWATLSREQQAETVLALQQGGMSRVKIAHAAGIKPRTVQTRAADAKSFSLAGTIPTGSIDVEIDRKLIIEEELDRKDRVVINRAARKNIMNNVVIQSAVEQLAEALNDQSAMEKSIAAHKKEVLRAFATKSKDLEEAIMVVSDLHHCRFVQGVIDEATTAGALNRYLDGSMKIVRRRRAHAKLETLTLCILGDALHGTGNFSYQDRETSGNSSYQIYKTAYLFIEFIQKLRVDFKSINIVMIPGNHGRKKDRNVMNDNLELEMYRIIEAFFLEKPDIKMVVVENALYIADVLGRKILMMHGDQLAAGNPSALIDAIRKYQDILPEFDDAIMGHWHRNLQLPLPYKHGSNVSRWLFVNGTASIDDEFLEIKFGSSPSLCYDLLFCNGKRIVSSNDVDLYE